MWYPKCWKVPHTSSKCISSVQNKTTYLCNNIILLLNVFYKGLIEAPAGQEGPKWNIASAFISPAGRNIYVQYAYCTKGQPLLVQWYSTLVWTRSSSGPYDQKEAAYQKKKRSKQSGNLTSSEIPGQHQHVHAQVESKIKSEVNQPWNGWDTGNPIQRLKTEKPS
jgi:hypothetical protein